MHRLAEYRDWLTYGLKLERWVELAADEMTGAEMLAMARKIAQVSTRLRSIVEDLGLDDRPQSPVRDAPEPLTFEQQAAIRAAAEINKQAIAELNAQERQAEYLSRLASGESIPRGDTRGGFANSHTGFAGDSVGPDGTQSGAGARSVATNGRDVESGAGALDAGDEAGDEP